MRMENTAVVRAVFAKTWATQSKVLLKCHVPRGISKTQNHRIQRVRKNFIPSYLKMEKLVLSAEKKLNPTLPLKSHVKIFSLFESGLLEGFSN